MTFKMDQGGVIWQGTKGVRPLAQMGRAANSPETSSSPSNLFITSVATRSTSCFANGRLLYFSPFHQTSSCQVPASAAIDSTKGQSTGLGVPAHPVGIHHRSFVSSSKDRLLIPSRCGKSSRRALEKAVARLFPAPRYDGFHHAVFPMIIFEERWQVPPSNQLGGLSSSPFSSLSSLPSGFQSPTAFAPIMHRIKHFFATH